MSSLSCLSLSVLSLPSCLFPRGEEEDWRSVSLEENMEESLNVGRPGGGPVEVILVLVEGLDVLAGVGGEGL